MSKQGAVVDIGLRVDYEQSLNKMKQEFNEMLTTMSKDLRKAGISKQISEQVVATEAKVKEALDAIDKKLRDMSEQGIDPAGFTAFQTEVVNSISKLDSEINALQDRIKDYTNEFDKTFKNISTRIGEVIPEIKEMFDLFDVSSNLKWGVSPGELKKAQEISKAYNKAAESYRDFALFVEKEQGKVDETTKDSLKTQLGDAVSGWKNAESALAEAKQSGDNIDGISHKVDLARIKVKNLYDRIHELSTYNGKLSLPKGISMKQLDENNIYVESLQRNAERIIQFNKALQDSAQTTVDTFQVKNGAIHVPVDVVKTDQTTVRLNKIIAELQKYLDKHPIYAEVDLVAGTKKSGRKTNKEVAEQLDTKKNPIEIGGSVRETYREALKEAEAEANTVIKTINSARGLVKEFKTIMESADDTRKGKVKDLGINSEVEALITKLQSISDILSSVGELKLGLDEAQINRITASIENMANMIQRAFGVASDSDIANQWNVIEGKFRSVAGEEGKLLKTNKEHKAAIHEVALEYQKYLEMGGKNEFSALTDHKRTVSNLTNEYISLGNEAKNVADVIEKGADKALAKAEIVQRAINSIPQANDTNRLIHWTSPESAAAKFSNPNGISLKGYGDITQFTDVLGEAERSSKAIVEYFNTLHHMYGDKVIVIDIPNDSFRKFSDMTKSPDFIPKEYIKGVIDATNGTVKLNNEQEKLISNQEKLNRTTSSKATTQDKEAARGVNAANKALADQAGKTATAIKKEADIAQSASEKFRRLAKEKGNAAYANRQLAEAAEATAIALEREAKARKEGAGKTPKRSPNAISSETYLPNAQQWQVNLREKLAGEYDEVYGGKINQATNGVVKFTAFVRNSNDVVSEGVKNWRTYTATINESGDIISAQIGEVAPKQIVLINKQQAALERYIELLEKLRAQAELQPLERHEMESYIQSLISEDKNLERFNIRNIQLNDRGGLSIVTDLKEADGVVKSFKANFDSVNMVIDESGKLLGDLDKKLESGFGSGTFTTRIKDTAIEVDKLQAKASRALNTFENKFGNSSNFSKVKRQVDSLKGSLDKIGDQSGLDKWLGRLDKAESKIKNLDVISKLKDTARQSIGKLESELKSSSNYSQISAPLKELKKEIKNINTQGDLDALISKLSALKTTVKDYDALQSKASRALGTFTLNNKDSSGFSQVEGQLEALKGTITSIDSQAGLDRFNEQLREIELNLKRINTISKFHVKDIELISQYEDLYKIAQKIRDLRVRKAGLDENKDKGQIKTLTCSEVF